MTTFGHTGTDGTDAASLPGLLGGLRAIPAYDGYLTTISVYVNITSGKDATMKCGLYRNADGKFLGASVERTDCLGTGAYAWYDFIFSPTIPITAGVEYLLSVWTKADAGYYVLDWYGEDASYYNTVDTVEYTSIWPDPFDREGEYTGWDFCIYGTYTSNPLVLSGSGNLIFTGGNNKLIFEVK